EELDNTLSSRHVADNGWRFRRPDQPGHAPRESPVQAENPGRLAGLRGICPNGVQELSDRRPELPESILDLIDRCDIDVKFFWTNMLYRFLGHEQSIRGLSVFRNQWQ